MDSLAGTIAKWGSIWSDNNIFLLTATVLLCVVLGLLVLWLKRAALPAEAWAGAIGCAYILLAVLYSARLVEALLSGTGAHSTPSLVPRLILALLWTSLSTLNNVMFFGAARGLMGLRLFPRWTAAVAVVVVVFDISLRLAGAPEGLARLPDGVFSSIALGYVGWATFVSISPTRRLFLAVAALLGGLAYGLLNLGFALNPFVAGRWPELVAILGGDKDAARLALDHTMFAVALFMKVVLFTCVTFLMLRPLVTLAPRVARELMRGAEGGEVDFLAPNGILRSIADSVDADIAELVFVPPGAPAGTTRLVRWVQNSELRELAGRHSIDLTSLSHLPVATALKEGKRVTCLDLTSKRRRAVDLSRYVEPVAGVRSFVAQPITYYGEVIACLQVKWFQPCSYTATTLQRLYQLGQLVAPTIQGRRDLVLLQECSERLPRLGNVGVPERVNEFETVPDCI